MATTIATRKRAPLAPIDDDVIIPPAVKAAAAAAAALHAQVYATPAEPDPAPAAVIEPVVDPAETVPAAAAEPVAEPVAVSTEPVAAPAVTEQSWQHKYHSMKGRFDRSEGSNRQLIDVNRQLADRNAGLEQTLATMAVTEPAPPAATAASRVTPEERATYGDEFIDVAGRIAQEQFAPLENTVKNLSERLARADKTAAQSARDQMHTYLNTNDPNWLITNDNPDFIRWLALPAPYSNAIKHNLLKAAYAANDGPSVLAFFQGFLSEEAALAPRTEQTPTPALAAVKVPLATFAAPGRAKTAAASPVPAEKPSFTRAEITNFYVDVAAKKYVGREDEKNRIERDIHAAGREGRVR